MWIWIVAVSKVSLLASNSLSFESEKTEQQQQQKKKKKKQARLVLLPVSVTQRAV